MTIRRGRRRGRGDGMGRAAAGRFREAGFAREALRLGGGPRLRASARSRARAEEGGLGRCGVRWKMWGEVGGRSLCGRGERSLSA